LFLIKHSAELKQDASSMTDECHPAGSLFIIKHRAGLKPEAFSMTFSEGLL
jgi:hypothetical protein